MEVPLRERTFLCNGGELPCRAGGGLWDQSYDPFRAVAQMGSIADDRFLCLPPHPLPRIPALSAAQTSEHISHILAFDSVQGLICGVHWGGWMAVLDREVSFWTCFSVDWFGSLERIKAPFVQPKSTEGPPLSSSVKRPDREIVHKIRFLSAAMIVHSLGLNSYLNIPSFLPFYNLHPLLLSCHTLILPLLQKASKKKSRCKESQDHWYFYGGWSQDWMSWVFVGWDYHYSNAPKPRHKKELQEKQGERLVCRTMSVNICWKAGAKKLHLFDIACALASCFT